MYASLSSVGWRNGLLWFLVIGTAARVASGQFDGFFQSVPGATATYEYQGDGFQTSTLPLNVSILLSYDVPTSSLTATILTPIIGVRSDGSPIYPIGGMFPLRVTGTSQDGERFHGALVNSQYLFDWRIEPVLAGGIDLSGVVYWAGGRYELTSIGHTLLPPALVGDYNRDGVVDTADYVLWRSKIGSNNSLPNDPIGGAIGSAQYDQWRFHLGQSTPHNRLVAGSGSSVPESPTFLVLAAAVLFSGSVARNGRWFANTRIVGCVRMSGVHQTTSHTQCQP